VSQAESANGVVTAVWSEAAARWKPHRATYYVLATGGILGGGILTDSNGRILETALGLPLALPTSDLLQREFLTASGHPLFRAGIPVDPGFQPLGPDGQRIFRNVWVAGAAAAGADPLCEHSLEGIALASGYRVAQNILNRLEGQA